MSMYFFLNIDVKTQKISEKLFWIRLALNLIFDEFIRVLLAAISSIYRRLGRYGEWVHI
jgi:hypothetical protein